MALPDGISMEFSDGRHMPAPIEDINFELRRLGTGIWPLDLSNEPDDIKRLLAKPKFDDAGSLRVKEVLFLSMERLLEVVTKAGCSPEVPGGSAIDTWLVNQVYGYPQLYQVEEGIDYARFDRFHVNASPDGTGVDEEFQMLSGAGFVIHQRLDGGGVLTITLSCPAPEQGWLGTYSGVRPHIGSVGSATVGSKFLVQAFGVPRWNMRYVGERTE